MNTTIAVRTGKDRLRYTCLFELFLVAMLAPIGAFFLQKEVLDFGLLTILLSLKAMLFNLLYNWAFDKLDVRAGRVPTDRSFLRRILHALGFEVGLVFTSLPIVIWWLGLSILQAILMDLVITSFVVFYTIVFTWGYDRLFPVSQIPTHLTSPLQG
jgi:uncharacterized membrane protein